MSREHRGLRLAFTGLLILMTAVGLTLGAGQLAIPAFGQRIVPLAPQLPALPNCQPYPSGSAIHLACIPANWNGNLIIYAHGYVSPEEQSTPTLPAETQHVGDLIEPLGFAFATTSFPDVGLVAPGAVTDLATLASEFKAQYPLTQRVFLVGVSEGGLITAKSIEQNAAIYSGGLACCGPVGDFQKQIDYFGDFFVVFNYFFPEVFPVGTGPGGVNAEVIADWESVYVKKVHAAITGSLAKANQVIRVTQAAVESPDAASVEQTFLSVLWYDVFATNDALQKFGGQPFDNSLRWYSGSSDDWALNRGVKRFHEDAAAFHAIQGSYQTSGILPRPLVTMHTTADPVIPYWQETLYSLKTLLHGSLLRHISIPVVAYGHCSFTDRQLLGAFALLYLRVTGHSLTLPQ